VATPPPLSPLPPLFVRLLFAIFSSFMRSRFHRVIYFSSCQLISNMPVKGKSSARRVLRSSCGGSSPHLSRSCQRVHRSESKSKVLRSWMPVNGDCVAQVRIGFQLRPVDSCFDYFAFRKFNSKRNLKNGKRRVPLQLVSS
jgi:hypothetical protein